MLEKQRKEWEMRMARNKDYPYKSGEIVGDLCMTLLGGFIIGTILSGLDKNLILGIVISIAILAIVILNSYWWLARPTKRFEEKYGPSTIGEEWLRKRGRSEEEIKEITSRYFK